MKSLKNKTWCVLLIVLMPASSVLAQLSDSIHTRNKKKLRTLALVSGSAYAITLVGLNELWYADNERQSFRFFNDNAEWKQVDKVGHFYSAFYLSYGTSQALKGCGLSYQKSNALGALTGFLILLPVEIFDGFSTAYGASAGDLLANAAGSGFFLAQSSLWNEIRIQPRFSFHTTRYSSIRPDVLGDTFASKLLKDYNGHTYWLSFDLDKFIKFPKWLNLAVGYGADGMVYAREAPNNDAGFSAHRQYYIGLDLDLTGIKTRSKALKTFFAIASMIKLPAPALEFSSKGTRFHAFYF